MSEESREIWRSLGCNRKAALALAAGVLGATSASAQDGWTVDRHERNQTTSAFVSFTTGQAISVRCTRGHAEVLAMGLPVQARPTDSRLSAFSRRIETKLDGKSMRSSAWLSSTDPTVAFYSAPGALARGLLKGHELSLRIVPESGPATRIVLPLPPDRSGLQTVLEECGLPLSDPRDEAIDLSDLPAGIPQWKAIPRAVYPDLAQRGGVREGLSIMSCFAEPDGSIRDCQSDYAAPPGYGFDEAALQAMRRARLEPREDLVARPISFTMRFRLE